MATSKGSPSKVRSEASWLRLEQFLLGTDPDCNNVYEADFDMSDDNNCVGSWCERDTNCTFGSCCYTSKQGTGPDQKYCSDAYCPNECVDKKTGKLANEVICEGFPCE